LLAAVLLPSASALKTAQAPFGLGVAPSPAAFSPEPPPGLADSILLYAPVNATSGVKAFPLPVGPDNVGKPFSRSECEVDLNGPLLMGDAANGGTELKLPIAVQSGLRGFWSFDFHSLLDGSTFGNNAFGRLTSGPALGALGSSAFFRRSFVEVSDAEGHLQLKDFTYTFWVYLIEDASSKGLKVCPLVRKGLGGSVPIGDLGRQSDASPAILFDRFSMRLRVELVTSGAPDVDPTLQLAEAFESNARVRYGRWYHVAVVRWDNARMTHLYVNGVLDSSHNTKGFLRPMREPLFVGGDPLTSEACDLPMYIDEVKVYDRALDMDEIQAEAAPSLMGIEPHFVRLACVNCPLELAARSCTEGYHICSSLEMHMGGYQVAHALGWLSSRGHVWSRKAVSALANQETPAPAPTPAPPVEDFAPTDNLPFNVPAVSKLLQVAGTLSGGSSGSVLAAAAEADVPTLGLGLCCADSL